MDQALTKPLVWTQSPSWVYPGQDVYFVEKILVTSPFVAAGSNILTVSQGIMLIKRQRGKQWLHKTRYWNSLVGELARIKFKYYLLLHTSSNSSSFCLANILLFQYLIFNVAQLSTVWTGQSFQIAENRNCLSYA